MAFLISLRAPLVALEISLSRSPFFLAKVLSPVHLSGHECPTMRGDYTTWPDDVAIHEEVSCPIIRMGLRGVRKWSPGHDGQREGGCLEWMARAAGQLWCVPGAWEYPISVVVSLEGGDSGGQR